MISAIAGVQGRGADGDVLMWRSTDGGGTWSAGSRLNEVMSSAREGLHAMRARGQTVFVAWLDLRSEGTTVYGAVSRDGGATWSRNGLVYRSPNGTVCECCHPSVAIDAENNVYVMFRNVIAGSRDLYLARSTDGGQSFSPARKLGSGTWQLNACPMDGGGVAVGSDGTPVAIWRRGREVFTASDDRSEERVGSGKDPSITLSRNALYAGWTSERGLQLRTPGRNEAIVLDKEGSYLQLVATTDGAVVATWERQGAIVTKRME